MASFTACPSCGQTLQLADALRGQDARCPDCRCTFVARVREGVEASGQVKAAEPVAESYAPMLELDELDRGQVRPTHYVARQEPVGRPAPRLRSCSYCGETVPRSTVRCRFCGRELGDPDRPEWEQPHAIRRDCEPHRGGLVLALGIVGLVAALIHIFAVIGFPLCIVTLVMSIGDLRQMDQGLMDPMGRSNTKAGKICAIVGICFSILWLLLFGLVMTGAIFG